MIVHRFRHVASGETAQIISIHGKMIRIRWEDGVEDEYHIQHINKLVSGGHWEIEN